MVQPSSRLVVVGASSRLGGLLVRRALAEGLPVLGTYRRAGFGVEALAADPGAAPESGGLSLRRLDVLEDDALEALAVELGADAGDPAASGEPLAVVYCCGLWSYGATAGFGAAAFDEIAGVGLRAPFLLTAALLRHVTGPLQVVLVTGLGGGRNAVPLHALYSLVADGVYSLVRAVGAELAGSERRVTGVALGLFDKGQEYIGELAAQLDVRRPGDLEEAAEVIYRLARRPLAAANGSVVELAGGLVSYQDAIRFLEARKRESGP